MTEQRTKKQQRGRARGETSASAPSRLEVRDGVARPDPVWAPFPLTELAIAVGMVLFLLGYLASADRAPALLGASALVLVVSVGELCLREHFAGFRPHSILLALLPVTAVHTLVVYAVTPSWNGPLALLVDLGVAALAAWFMRGRYRLAHARAKSKR